MPAEPLEPVIHAGHSLVGLSFLMPALVLTHTSQTVQDLP